MTLTERVSTLSVPFKDLRFCMFTLLLFSLHTSPSLGSFSCSHQDSALTSRRKGGYGKVTLASYSLTRGFLNNLETDVFWETTEG